MATRYHIGAATLRGAISAYAKRFDLLEVRIPAAADRRLAPAASTLKKWRKDVPPHFEFSVVAGPAVARLKPSAALDAELELTLETARQLRARCIVLRTPPDVTPAALWRDRMVKLLDRLPSDVTHVVWEPSGLWEDEEAALRAKKWGVVLGVDPSRQETPPGPIAYGRLRAFGETRAYGPSALEKVVKNIGDRREAFVIIETDGALDECKRLRQLAQRKQARPLGGSGRVIRPRAAALRVRDDEQE